MWELFFGPAIGQSIAIWKRYSKPIPTWGSKGLKSISWTETTRQWSIFITAVPKQQPSSHLMIDYHGAYKPTGLHRTYPNVINFEGVYGLEQVKWAPPSIDMVTYDVTMPYIRMLAGPLDYTQGAMRNATRENYRPINQRADESGHALPPIGEYVVFESPLNMLCDSPSNYLREPECTRFISDIPTVWDQTLAVDGTIGEYIVMARKKDDVWYIGGLTKLEKREITVDLTFLDKSSYEIELFSDGVNADRAARDYKREIVPLPNNRKLTITLMPWRIRRKNQEKTIALNLTCFTDRSSHLDLYRKLKRNKKQAWRLFLASSP